MNNNRQKILDTLNNLNVAYEIIEHSAVKTMAEMNALALGDAEIAPKNLFLCDDKKKRFFLVSILGDTRVNLKELQKKLNCRPLSFASEAKLENILGLEKGAVSPLASLNAQENLVEVVLDEQIKTLEKVGVHPNDNTATVYLSPQALEKVIRNQGNKLIYIALN